jgi:Tfp pilus assembly protein PilN
MKVTRLHLEFAPAARHISWPGVTLLTAGVVLLGSVLVLSGLQMASNAKLADELAETRAQVAQTTGGAKQTKATTIEPGELARVRAVRRVARNLKTPWSDVLEALESAPNESVALLSVEPSAAKRSLRITAEARNAQDMLEYVGALQRDARLSGVVLASHELQAKAPGTPVRFQVQAAWGTAP